MSTRKLTALLGALALCAAAGCKDEAAGGPTAGQGGGDGATDWGAFNQDCAEHPPFGDVPGGPRGTCCYRSEPNSTRIQQQIANGDALLVTEHRINHQQTINHPNSLGHMALIPLSNSRNDYHEWNMLWRFERPHMNGTPVAGPGFVTVGWGGYNCDGTHSHYGPTAAPVDKMVFPGAQDPARWIPQRNKVTFQDPSVADAGAEVAFDDRYLDNTFTPFLNGETFALDWELIAQGFTIESMDFSDTGIDCTGSFSSATRYTASHHFRSYIVVDDNHYVENGIPTLGLQTMSQLTAFGLIATDEDRMTLNPKLDAAGMTPPTPRCQITPEDLMKPPPDRTCRWVKLPTALCPIEQADRLLWSCHLGAEGNNDGDGGADLPTSCTATAPTTPRNESAPDEGQCCDPMGDPATGLPPCNAWILRNEYVAAAADITTEMNQIDQRCPDAVN